MSNEKKAQYFVAVPAIIYIPYSSQCGVADAIEHVSDFIHSSSFPKDSFLFIAEDYKPDVYRLNPGHELPASIGMACQLESL